MTPDSFVETLREWMKTTNPGLVTRDDLARVESRLEELEELVEALEAKLAKGGERSQPDSFDKDE